MKYFRERYKRKNVTPQKVHDSYDGCEDFFISVGKSYIVAALIKFFGMTKVDDYPTENGFPVNMIHKSDNEIKQYFDTYIGKFVSSFIFQQDQAPPPNQGDDYVKNYGLCMMYLTIVLLQLKDTAAEGDGDRNFINQKLLLSIFKSLNAYSKYAIEMFVSIAQVECLLTERTSAQVKWGCFSNWTGGLGRNIEDDLVQEICNSISKNAVKRMGANKSLHSIEEICRATSGIKLIIDTYDKQLNIHKLSSRHTTASAKEDDHHMIDEILLLGVYDYQNGRYHNSFPDLKRSPMLNLNHGDFDDWIEKRKTQMTTL